LNGGIAQLGEHLICIQKVAGSIPVASTKQFKVDICLESFSVEKKIEKKEKKMLTDEG
jgi:hypothetical protein